MSYIIRVLILSSTVYLVCLTWLIICSSWHAAFYIVSYCRRTVHQNLKTFVKKVLRKFLILIREKIMNFQYWAILGKKAFFIKNRLSRSFPQRLQWVITYLRRSHNLLLPNNVINFLLRKTYALMLCIHFWKMEPCYPRKASRTTL